MTVHETVTKNTGTVVEGAEAEPGSGTGCWWGGEGISITEVAWSNLLMKTPGSGTVDMSFREVHRLSVCNWSGTNVKFAYEQGGNILHFYRVPLHGCGAGETLSFSGGFIMQQAGGGALRFE